MILAGCSTLNLKVWVRKQLWTSVWNTGAERSSTRANYTLCEQLTRGPVFLIKMKCRHTGVPPSPISLGGLQRMRENIKYTGNNGEPEWKVGGIKIFIRKSWKKNRLLPFKLPGLCCAFMEARADASRRSNFNWKTPNAICSEGLEDIAFIK